MQIVQQFFFQRIGPGNTIERVVDAIRFWDGLGQKSGHNGRPISCFSDEYVGSFVDGTAGARPGGPMSNWRDNPSSISIDFRSRKPYDDCALPVSDDLRVQHAGGPLEHSILSVVIPAKNEAPNLPQLMDEIIQALRPLSRSSTNRLAGFEVLIVDDASTDETPQVLSKLSEAYSELRWLRLASTVGQSSATVAGIRAARGNWIATLDADLQNNPADLIRLWKALPGYDVALGWRLTRQDVVSKRLISRCANQARNIVLRQAIHDTGCSVRIFSRAMALRLPMFHGMHRFIGPLLLREGCKLVQVPVCHRPRVRGASHYTIWNRSLSVIVDLLGVTWLMRRPVHYRVIPMQNSGSVVFESSSSDTVSARAAG
jgi:dolichol-phosphate mannosyltransferase